MEQGNKAINVQFVSPWKKKSYLKEEECLPRDFFHMSRFERYQKNNLKFGNNSRRQMEHLLNVI